MKTLRELASDPSAAMDLGKAAEHLVCADLMLTGYRCYLSDQGLPYDLVIDADGRLLRVQVKAASFPRNVNMAGKAERMAYTWAVRKRGKSGKGTRLNGSHCDLVALVALDVRMIAYFPILEVGTTCQLMPVNYEFRGKYKRNKYAAVDGFPIGAAIERLGK